MNRLTAISAILMTCMLMHLPVTVASAVSTAEEPANDIRILVDVSGSMKWNDPQNLRTPALRLVTNLLPKGTQAGVWTFGKYVNMLVPLGIVDDAWHERASQAASELHSYGLFTNIADTLDKATWDWKEADDHIQRSVILLTDGLVDISKDTAEDERSRSRILDDILPRIKRAGGTIYTIALSGEADEVLMRQLSAATNGWYEKAETAEVLEKIFFRMFEKAANPDTLPLVDNNVLVDESIEELTLLVFRKDDQSQSQIVMPDNQTFGESSAPANVKWHHEDRYDLVTITRPMPGTWHVNADVDPDNRVMVVTNLRMITTTLPNNISLGDDYTLYVSLTQKNKVIEQKDFLHFIKVRLDQQSGEQHWDWMLLDNGRDADETRDDGIYAVHLDKTLVEGEHTLTVNVDGTTFKRVHRQVVNVYDSPVVTAISPATENGDEGFILSVTPRAGMIDTESMAVTAIITDKDKNHKSFDVPRINTSEWRLSLADLAPTQRYSAAIDIAGVRPNGKPVSRHIGPLYFGKDLMPAEEKNAPDASETPVAHDNTKDGSGIENMDMDDSINWLYTSIEVLVFNILFATGIFLGIRIWRKTPQTLPTPWDDLVHE
jgi:uncharacterized protein (TIGR03503 family)